MFIKPFKLFREILLQLTNDNVCIITRSVKCIIISVVTSGWFASSLDQTEYCHLLMNFSWFHWHLSFLRFFLLLTILCYFVGVLRGLLIKIELSLLCNIPVSIRTAISSSRVQRIRSSYFSFFFTWIRICWIRTGFSVFRSGIIKGLSAVNLINGSLQN